MTSLLFYCSVQLPEKEARKGTIGRAEERKMPSRDTAYSRPEKIDHAQTVLYEIDLLRFARTRLEEASTEGDEWVYLEDFLLHYRNLIEFFGKPQNQARAVNGDLSILRPQRIWPKQVPDKALLDSMTRPD